jgi:hypothetical protein
LIVLPYLGAEQANAELTRRPPAQRQTSKPALELPRRASYRTGLVLKAIASAPRANNRAIALAAGLSDEGQTSKLLSRLRRQGLVENVGLGQAYGEPNAWLLTGEGRRIVQALEQGSATGKRGGSAMKPAGEAASLSTQPTPRRGRTTCQS